MANKKIIKSWEQNAAEWIKTIQEETIASRKITNPAIIEVLKRYNPSTLLDLGCGEGWLTRKLNEEGIQTVGIDGTSALIERAKLIGSNDYYVQSYEQIINNEPVEGAPYEGVVFNFCLYLKEEVVDILKVIPNYLTNRRLIFIQTLHPFAFPGGDFNYEDQWLDDSWKGLKGSFTSPHKWYYRTLEGWATTFAHSGLSIAEISEPLLPDKSKPASIIFTLTKAND